MIIYEVNLLIDPEISESYLVWLAPHVDDMLNFTGFVSAELFEVETDEKWCAYCVQYRVESRAHLQNYFDTHAAAMRDDGICRFGDKFTASRRILQLRD